MHLSFIFSVTQLHSFSAITLLPTSSKKYTPPDSSKGLSCGSHPLSRPLQSCVTDLSFHLLYFLCLSLTTGSLPSASKSAQPLNLLVSLSCLKTSPDSQSLSSFSGVSSQPDFLELPTLCLYFLTSHSLLIPLTYYIEPLEAACITDSTPIISPNLPN